MPRTLKLPLALAVIGCAAMTASCATLFPDRAPPPPVRLAIPQFVKDPCPIYTLPSNPTLADLEAGYAIRGEQIVNCELARQMAVFVIETERGE